MSKYPKNSIYQTEYSVAFQWKKKENSENIKKIKNLKSNSISEESTKSINEIHVHKYRHKMKQILLEKIENLEAEINRNSVLPNKRSNYNASEKSVITSKSKTNKVPNHNDKKDSNWQNELRRSRSLALEFKEKNESTQIWWWNDDIDFESSESDTGNLSPPTTIMARRSLVDSDYMLINRRQSFLSAKKSITEPSQSTYTRSSVSAQMAQATGYQSTTDDFSSFNHDNDGKSSDQNEVNIKSSKLHNSFTFKSVDVPRLTLSISGDEEHKATNCGHLVFQEPYQKEDFIKDTTTSSESNIAMAPSSDTYRLG